jgi:pimeloyl-ACP methyl ester carboxylesterase
MRAREPDADGYAERDGVKLYWEQFGDGSTTIAMLPTWSFIPSRYWKCQVPYLARRHRVVTFDGRGSGSSSRPAGWASYTDAEFAHDALDVLDATNTDRAVLAGMSCGARWGIQLAAEHPDRVLGLVALGPAVPLACMLPERRKYAFDAPLDATEGWAKYNALYWNRAYPDFVDFFAARMVTEPHSTKQIDDIVGWGLEIDPVTLVDTDRGEACGTREPFRETCERVRCPVLVIHGDEDAVRSHEQGIALAEATGGEFVTIAGGGHTLPLRHPVVVNHLIARFVDRVAR